MASARRQWMRCWDRVVMWGRGRLEERASWARDLRGVERER